MYFEPHALATTLSIPTPTPIFRIRTYLGTEVCISCNFGPISDNPQRNLLKSNSLISPDGDLHYFSFGGES